MATRTPKEMGSDDHAQDGTKPRARGLIVNDASMHTLSKSRELNGRVRRSDGHDAV